MRWAIIELKIEKNNKKKGKKTWHSHRCPPYKPFLVLHTRELNNFLNFITLKVSWKCSQVKPIITSKIMKKKNAVAVTFKGRRVV